MVIIKKQENEVIIKQLTDLLNKSFEQSLAKTIQNHNSVRIIKKRTNQKPVVGEALILTRFIANWIDNTYYDSLECYADLMNSDDHERFFWTFESRPYSRMAFKAMQNSFFGDMIKPSSPLFEQTIIPLTKKVKEHSGSIEESLLAVIKPFLVNELLVLLMNKLETTLELLSIVHHYNDYDYQLQRFIKSFEQNLIKEEEDKEVLELLSVWWLDETFLKETIIPELKKHTLTTDQKQKGAIDSSCINLVNNYYDYCLYYAFSENYASVSPKLIDTVFFYTEDDFIKGMTLIKKSLLVNYRFSELDVQGIEESLLEDVECKRPEWVDSVRSLLSGY